MTLTFLSVYCFLFANNSALPQDFAAIVAIARVFFSIALTTHQPELDLTTHRPETRAMSHKQLTLFRKVLKDESAIYANPTSKYEEFVECWYQCHRGS